MGLFDKMREVLGVSDDDYEDDDVEVITSKRGQWDEEDDGNDTRRNNKVVNIHTTAQLQVILVKPERFDDAASIADHLNEKRTVVLNLESTNKDVSRRLVDFLSGVAYANGGQIKRIAASTFLITPYNVGIMGDILDELENNGVFF